MSASEGGRYMGTLLRSNSIEVESKPAPLKAKGAAPEEKLTPDPQEEAVRDDG